MIIILLTVSTLLLLRWFLRKHQRLPYPPGPPADPLIGHLRVIPKKDQENVFYAWGKLYGDVIYLSALGKSIVVLNSEEAAAELLERRSANSSHRPRFALPEAIGWTDQLSFLPYGEAFLQQRRLIQQPFVRKNIPDYKAVQEEETAVLLHELFVDPGDFEEHLHRLSTAMILNITYGHRISSRKDEGFQIAKTFVLLLRECIQPSLLDISPLFAKLPRWFPGAWFVRFAEEARPLIEKSRDYPINIVQEQRKLGTAQPSIVSNHLEELAQNGSLDDEHIQLLKVAANQIFSGASETTWHSLTTFIYCMILYPDVQKKAQEEIDRVVGTQRLPDFTDKDSLPYIECVMMETLRWHPVTPLGVPHQTVADEEYNGMLIPGGSTIISNARAMTLDERKFSDPHSFIPERYLPAPEGRGELFPAGAVFGWGRRVCPGRHLAEATLWLAIARILATFMIAKPVDAEGRPIEQEIKYITAVTSHPEPFKCVIKPRSLKSEEVIAEAYQHTYPATHSSEI